MVLTTKFIRENADAIRKDLDKRGDSGKKALLEKILAADADLRKVMAQTQKLRARRNEISKEIDTTKRAGKDISSLLNEAKNLPEKIKTSEAKLNKFNESLSGISQIPNILHPTVPEGVSEEENKVLREHGKKPKFSFKPESHIDLLQKLDLADIPRAAKISGARFYFLKNELVLLEMALLQFALDKMHKKGYSLINPPYMIRRKPYEAVTDLSDFESVMYKIEGEDLYLIATSEHPIAAMHLDEILETKKLPLKYCGMSPCFRKEAGAHGKDTRGIFRVHEFHKVEQFVFCKPEDSEKLHEELLKNAEEVFKELELPYRVVEICTGEIGTVASRKYDIEVWMPAQNTYREVVSCSNCTSYQSIGLNTRYRKKDGETEYVHTLNSTAIATPRAIVAIMENFQQKNGTIKLPKAIHPYMHGIKEISLKRK